MGSRSTSVLAARYCMAKRSQSKRSAPLKRKPIDFQLLQIFDVVYRLRSLTRALPMLPGISSQPQLTKKIGILEDLLGGVLFVRAGAGVNPTMLADRLVEPIRQQIDHFENVLSKAKTFDPLMSEQTFVLHIRPDIAPFLSPRLVKRIVASAPNIDIYMKARRDKLLASDLRAGDPQLAVYTEPVEDRYCNHEPLFEDRIAVIARKDHPRIKGKHISKELYGELEHIIVARTGPHDAGPFELLCRNNGIKRHVRLATPIPTLVPEILNATDLVATTSRRMANYFRRHFNIAVYDLPIRDVKLTYYMIWHKLFQEDEGHTWLRNEIKELAREIAAEVVS